MSNLTLSDKAVHLFSLIFEDLHDLTDVELGRDLVTLVARTQHEGLPFLTRTLPAFGDIFFQSTMAGSFQPLNAFAFKGALPKFLSGLTSRVFDENTGVLLKDPCYVSAYAVRQICYLLYKMEMPITDRLASTAIKRIRDVDSTLDEQVNVSSFDKVLLLANSLITEVLRSFSWDDTIPRHGPGSANQRIDYPWEKWHFWDDGTDMLPDEYFTTPGLDPLCIGGGPYHMATRLGLTPHTVFNMSQSKLSLVAKNAKAVRPISKETVRRMWAQLGIDSLIRRRVGEHPYTRTSINFDDQSVNANAALKGSRTGQVATIDLSEASNRLSMKLCRWLLPVEWYRALERVRSAEMQLPDGSSIVLRMMGPMGNGATFSLETIVFWAIASAAIAHSIEETYCSEDDLKWACLNTLVYGDDIIVPVEYASTVMSSLERYGFRINRDKSYWTGPFRESCGTDAFLGADITPLRIKTPPRNGRRKYEENVDAKFVDSWWNQSQDWKQLLPRTSAWMTQMVYDELGFIPTYPEGWSGCIGVPVPFEGIRGIPISKQVEQRRAMSIQKVIEVLLRQETVNEEAVCALICAVLLQRRHPVPPSDGKRVKVCRCRPVKLYAPLDEFPEELEYFRWLQMSAGRVAVDQPLDSRTFTIRYTTMVSIRREWLS